MENLFKNIKENQIIQNYTFQEKILKNNELSILATVTTGRYEQFKLSILSIFKQIKDIKIKNFRQLLNNIDYYLDFKNVYDVEFVYVFDKVPKEEIQLYVDFFEKLKLDYKIIDLEERNYHNSGLNYNLGLDFCQEKVLLQNVEIFHIGDVLKYFLENYHENKYFVFNCSFNKSNNENQDFYELNKNQIFKKKYEQNIWYQHHYFNNRNLHFLVGFSKNKINKLFDEDFYLSPYFEDDIVPRKIAYLNQVSIHNVKKYDIFGIHLNHSRIENKDYHLNKTYFNVNLFLYFLKIKYFQKNKIYLDLKIHDDYQNLLKKLLKQFEYQENNNIYGENFIDLFSCNYQTYLLKKKRVKIKKVYCLTLFEEHRLNHMNKIKEQLNYNFEFFKGFNPFSKNIKNKFINEPYAIQDFKFASPKNNNFTIYQYCCFISFIYLFNKIYNELENDEYAIICEDDILPTNSNSIQVLNNLSQFLEINENPYILKIGCASFYNQKFDKFNLGIYDDINNVYSNPLFCANKKFIKLVLDNFDGKVPTTFDSFMYKICKGYESNILLPIQFNELSFTSQIESNVRPKLDLILSPFQSRVIEEYDFLIINLLDKNEKYDVENYTVKIINEFLPIELFNKNFFYQNEEPNELIKKIQNFYSTHIFQKILLITDNFDKCQNKINKYEKFIKTKYKKLKNNFYFIKIRNQSNSYSF